VIGGQFVLEVASMFSPVRSGGSDVGIVYFQAGRWIYFLWVRCSRGPVIGG
jgi:hypothetical protein